MTKSPVNTFTEWGRLQEVIVGDFRNYTIPKRLDDVETSFRSFYHDNIWSNVRRFRLYKLNVYADDIRTYPEQIEEERTEDLDGIARLLESFDVVVKRPRAMTEIKEFRTPDWANVTSPCGNVRDQFLIIGDEIIETPPVMRGRYFENDHVKHIFLDYFRRGARWTVAPRPLMLDESFDRSYFDENPPGFDANNFEIMFDGAQCLKLGTDILFNVSNQNHVLGAIWLQRHLGQRFRVHQVRIADVHIDGAALPLRPGTLLVTRRAYEHRDLLPPALQKWDFIVFADEPARLRHSRLFAGAFHCSTLDIRRDERLETYL
jgi:glycine amidinotransferase